MSIKGLMPIGFRLVLLGIATCLLSSCGTLTNQCPAPSPDNTLTTTHFSSGAVTNSYYSYGSK